VHALLARQLKRIGIALESAPLEWRALLDRVSQTYADADQDRYRFERSMTISSEEMRELAESLAAERDRLRAIFDSAAVGICNALPDCTIIDCNEAYARMLGRTRADIIGRSWVDFIHPDERGKGMTTAFAYLAQPTSFERKYIHRDGSTVWGIATVSTMRDSTGAAFSNIAVVRDITAQRHLEQTLSHAQKLEAVGRLAAGVAHEINTPLQFLGDNITFLDRSLTALLGLYRQTRALMPAAHASIERLEQAADLEFIAGELPRAIHESAGGVAHVARIVGAMKVLAHHEQSGRQTLVDVNTTLRSVVTIAHSEIKYVADVRFELGDIPPVLAYADDLSQVFLNLVVNAAHATADSVRTKGRGEIRVSTRRDGANIVIEIADTGCGIPENIRARVFDPFFTTKEVGRGTGQGLSIARAIIVDKHHGTLSFDTQVGVGTVFFVQLAVAGSTRSEAA